MTDDDRIYVVQRLIAEHVKSPALRHIRDPYTLGKLAKEIVRSLDHRGSRWRKWDDQREALLKSACLCWIPIEDLRGYLNEMPGANLTATDVAQRLREFQEEPYSGNYPNEELKPSCLTLYEEEKAAGTELPAIIGCLQEHVDREDERLRLERASERQRFIEEEKLALERRFLSGADCKWTPVRGSKPVYCRMNGRTYRLSPTADKMWQLHRIASLDDADGKLVGKYRTRGDATKALAQVAYQAEW